MEILWEAEQGLTPRDVRERLSADRSVAYTTVMTALSRLWKKGLLDRRRAGNAYAYSPKAGRSETAAARMEEILDAAGNRTVTLARFLETLSASERRAVRSLLDER